MSLLFVTVAATLVPPEPKPELSLTWETENGMREYGSGCGAGMRVVTYDGDELRGGRVFELEAVRGLIVRELLVYDCADFDVVWKRGRTIGND